eukprot:GHVR01187389.1.p1 GENE.GHVR01187389.1~~GHVR01187389.1.p1  ORF type:complete len:123 (-),score=18.71 GHVR01187389.1:19-387(-)
MRDKEEIELALNTAQNEVEGYVRAAVREAFDKGRIQGSALAVVALMLSAGTDRDIVIKRLTYITEPDFCAWLNRSSAYDRLEGITYAIHTIAHQETKLWPEIKAEADKLLAALDARNRAYLL